MSLCLWTLFSEMLFPLCSHVGLENVLVSLVLYRIRNGEYLINVISQGDCRAAGLLISFGFISFSVLFETTLKIKLEQWLYILYRWTDIYDQYQWKVRVQNEAEKNEYKWKQM